ncbi:MAG: hypothetical protein V2I97_12445 [Desulfococcaceae bacterium]|jgi:hypothetical protein|nr:hypothetical protein [Desulfococcaceae bacterium]
MENKREKTEKSTARSAVSALLTGKALKSRDMAEMLREERGRDIRISTVSGILSRLGDPLHCELGHFIRKSKEGNALVYCLVPEALALSESRAYDLSVKRKKGRYTLEQAVQDYPALRKYCRSKGISGDFGSPGRFPMLRIMKKIANPSDRGGIFRFRSAENSPDRTMEISLRYSGSDCLSLRASFSSFLLICCVLVTAFALCCFAVWSFLMPVLIAGILISLIWHTGIFLKKKYEQQK